MEKKASIDGRLYRDRNGRQCYIGEQYDDPDEVLTFYKSDGKQMFDKRSRLITEEAWLALTPAERTKRKKL